MIMRQIPSYTFDAILDEKVPRTIVLLDLIKQEKEMEEKAYKKAKRKGRK